MRISNLAEKIKEAEINIAALTSEERLERLLVLANRFLKSKAKVGQISETEAMGDEALSLVLSWKEKRLTPLGAECLTWVITQEIQSA